MDMKRFSKACSELVKSGECHGDCCGPLIMFASDFDELKHRARKGYESELVRSSDGLHLYTSGFDCPFLSRESRRCRIYKHRPKVCRKFGDETHELLSCPHLDSSGVRRSEKLIVDFGSLRESLISSLRRKGV